MPQPPKPPPCSTPTPPTAEQLAGTEGVSEETGRRDRRRPALCQRHRPQRQLLETLSAEEAAAVLTSVFVPVNLNSGTEEEIRLIPGMTDKMVHEFEEYRPYADMGVFDRESASMSTKPKLNGFKNYVTL